MMIAWGAESAQFFMAQGFALLILAWMQTLPEFAVEAVLAWHRQTPLLIANLTGAIRLLTGLGWPMIYATAAFAYRAKYRKQMQKILIPSQQSVQIVGVMVCLLYVAVICIKQSLDILDAVILLLIYAAYIWLLWHMPTEEGESEEELGRIPHAIVRAKPPLRNTAILLCFLVGGAVIFLVADPFLGSLFALSSAIGVPQFVFIQWVAPFVSEFPEQVSAFYWARSIEKAPLALMNMVSSNITQWTLLAATLPIVLSISQKTPSSIPFDALQTGEVWMTLGQSLLGTLFLVNMQLAWWEAALLFVLWVVQFGFSLVPPMANGWGFISAHIHHWTTLAYFAWSAVELVRLLTGQRQAHAFREFAKIWRTHVRA